MQKPLTVVIPEHNEGAQINDTLDSLLSTSNPDLYDVIVVSDGSSVSVDLSGYGNVNHIVSPKRRGVGAAFDLGVSQAQSPHLIIMGSDMRFEDNDYMSKMLGHLEKEENEKSFICTTVKGTTPKSKSAYFGAKILFWLTADDLPKNGITMRNLKKIGAVSRFKNILESKWRNPEERDFYEIPCVLGAFYGVRKEWYDHIEGFKGHRYWGTLEPFISTKSWFAGGACKLDKSIITKHIFKVRPSHKTSDIDRLFNKLMATEILFDDNIKEKLLDFIAEDENLSTARAIFADRESQIAQYKEDFRKVKVRNLAWFNDRWGVKYYDSICG